MSILTDLAFVRTITKRMVRAEDECDRLRKRVRILTCPHCDQGVNPRFDGTECENCERIVCGECQDQMRSIRDGLEQYCIVCQTNQCSYRDCVNVPQSMCDECEDLFCAEHIDNSVCVCGQINYCPDCKDVIMNHIQNHMDRCDVCLKRSCRWHGGLECIC